MPLCESVLFVIPEVLLPPPLLVLDGLGLFVVSVGVLVVASGVVELPAPLNDGEGDGEGDIEGDGVGVDVGVGVGVGFGVFGTGAFVVGVGVTPASSDPELDSLSTVSCVHANTLAYKVWIVTNVPSAFSTVQVGNALFLVFSASAEHPALVQMVLSCAADSGASSFTLLSFSQVFACARMSVYASLNDGSEQSVAATTSAVAKTRAIVSTATA